MQPVLNQDGAQAHIDGYFTAIFASANQVESESHRTGKRSTQLLRQMGSMRSPQPPGKQEFQGLGNQFALDIPKKRLQLRIHLNDRAGRIDDDQGIRYKIKQRRQHSLRY